MCTGVGRTQGPCKDVEVPRAAGGQQTVGGRSASGPEGSRGTQVELPGGRHGRPEPLMELTGTAANE